MDELGALLVSWKPAYATHIESVDRQHKALIAMIARLQEAMLLARAAEDLPTILDGLVTYARYHFAWEEQLLEQHGYPDLEKHRQEHAALTEQVVDLQQKQRTGKLPTGGPVMRLLRRWLTEHIVRSDLAYAPFLREKGVQ